MASRLSRSAVPNRIRDTARALFVASGYDATTIADILQATSLSNGSFFHAFASKLEVARSVWEQATEGHEAAVFPAFEEHRDPLATLRQVIGTELSWFEANPDLGRMLIELPACLRGRDDGLLAAAQGRLLAAVRRWVARTPTDTAPLLPLPVIAAIIFGPTHALCAAWLDQPASERPSDRAEQLASAAWAGLQSARAAQPAPPQRSKANVPVAPSDLFGPIQSPACSMPQKGSRLRPPHS